MALSHALLFGLVLVWWTVFSETVTEPYMDEPFHVGQTLRYVDGNWSEWDPKITTPPGLYVIGCAWHHAWTSLQTFEPELFSKEGFNNLAVLRLLCIVIYIALLTIRRALQEKEQTRALVANCETTQSDAEAEFGKDRASLASLTMPVLFFYAPFYYTDGASVLTISTLFAVLARKAGGADSAVCFGLSVFAVSLRQTNIIWVGFCYGVALLHESGVISIADIFGSFDKVRSILSNLFFKARYLALLLLLVLFSAFVCVNGGIVLGDKSNHQAVFHPTQLVYLMCLLPFFYPIYSLQALSLASKQKVAWTLTICAWAMFATYCLRYHLISHPFTLADNRHYTFYLWKCLQLADPESLRRYILVPVSTFGLVGLLHAFSRVRSTVFVLYTIATTCTLIFSPLFEPRYFVLPLFFIQYAASVPEPSSQVADSLHILLHAAINAVTIFVFVAKPFVFADGTAGRFMW
ncbi:hypothetical protein DIPPA_52200 [Diplonema papillatum]|nr:hypothetical protein DIPPA_52200 [Diplonema papillatum]